ncbi:MAG: DEAD/DEAH box helicase, partial [Fibrobacter sp.]|nr:DEAD/DEAH box helicase [Fibrobacter sp.]
KIIVSLEKAGYNECMPVQAQTLQHTLQSKDVFVQSQTGTGKTAAFLVSLFTILCDQKNANRKALVITPTRELAIQVEKEALLLSQELGLGICSFYGGVGYGRQEQALASGVQLMIGTPGRILDFKKSGKINFKDLAAFVIDEADRLFDMGFLPDVTKMLRSLSTESRPQIMLFSATLSREVRMIAREYMNSPAEIEIAPEKVTVEAIEQQVFHVAKDEKMNLLLGILSKEKPKNVLIFTNQKESARIVAERLKYNGFHCEFLSGDLPQGKRTRIIEDVKNGKISYLVATDVAARGIHIDDLEMVINYDIPEYSENYVHRIGRTARAGKTGKAISLACEDFVYGLKSIEDFTKNKIPVGFADKELFIEDKSAAIDYRHLFRNAGKGNFQNRERHNGKKPGNHSGKKQRPVQTHVAKVNVRNHTPNPLPQRSSSSSGVINPYTGKPIAKIVSKPLPKPEQKSTPVITKIHNKTINVEKKSWLRRFAIKLFG